MKVKVPFVRNIYIEGEFIKLDSFLKLAGVAMTGGEAKMIISGGGASVNGEETYERGRKLRHGTIVSAGGKLFRVVTGG